MKYFICSEDPEYTPLGVPCPVEAVDFVDAKAKMCGICKLVSPAENCAGPRVFNENGRKCRVCGCTDNYKYSCWSEEDLCPACADLVNQIIVTKGPYDVLLERAKKIKKHGFDAEHDDKNIQEELRWAARSYLMKTDASFYWPWQSQDWGYRGEKDSYRQRLITAAALIIAEIERIDRAEARTEEQQ